MEILTTGSTETFEGHGGPLARPVMTAEARTCPQTGRPSLAVPIPSFGRRGGGEVGSGFECRVLRRGYVGWVDKYAQRTGRLSKCFRGRKVSANANSFHKVCCF